MLFKNSLLLAFIFLCLSGDYMAAKERTIPVRQLDKATLERVVKALQSLGSSVALLNPEALSVNAETCPEKCGIVDGNCVCQPDGDGKCPGDTRPTPDGICIGPLGDLRVLFGSDHTPIGLSLR